MWFIIIMLFTYLPLFFTLGRLISCKTKCSLSRLALNQSLEAFPYPSEFENESKPSKKHLLKRMSSNSLKLEMLDYYTTNQSHWFRPAKPANKRKSSNGILLVVEILHSSLCSPHDLSNVLPAYSLLLYAS